MGESCPAVCAVRFLHGRKGKFILYCFVPIRGGRTTPHGDHAGRCVSTGAGRCCAPVGRTAADFTRLWRREAADFRELNKKEAPAFYASASCVLLPKKMHLGKLCGSMDSRFCAICIFAFLRFFRPFPNPNIDIQTNPYANRCEKRAVHQHSPLSYFSRIICSYTPSR